MKFEYVVSANNEQIYQGEIHGCTFEVHFFSHMILTFSAYFSS